MKKVAVVTTTRADYGILKPLLWRLHLDPDITLGLIVTGTHLLKDYGYTIQEIETDQIPISRTIAIMEGNGNEEEMSNVLAEAVRKFSAYFLEEQPEMVVLLGDRVELLGIASAAMLHHVPIAHIHGGEVTMGAMDDAVRHAITKMSYLHFPSTEVYRRRIIQMGEEPDRVYNVGALSTENICNEKLLTRQEFIESVGLEKDAPYVVVTYHPVTREAGSEATVRELLQAMDKYPEYQYIITKANADAGGYSINQYMEEYSNQRTNVRLVDSLGMKRYLSAIKYAEFVLGNSSSGVIEAPVLGTITVNIGNRQAGRWMAPTVIQAEADAESIIKAMKEAGTTEKQEGKQYFGDGHTSEKIVAVLKDLFENGKIDLEKKFFDLSYDGQEERN